MGIWDQFRSVAGIVTSRSIPSDSKESRGLYVTDFAAAVTKFTDAVRSNGAQKLEDYVPDPQRREKIGRVVTNLGKFAVSSAVNESLKGVTAAGGIQVYKIVKEGLKDQPSQSAHRNNKPDLPVTVGELQAKMEKMQEEMDKIRQLNAETAHCAKTSDPLKELSEPSDESVSLKTDVRKVMIRSRL